MAPPPLTESEVRRILLALEPLCVDRRIVLVGGQAVAFWTRFLAERFTAPELRLALASKDIDFEGGPRAVREAAALLAGEARIPAVDDHTPNTGVVIYTDPAGHRRTIDFVESPLGLRARDVRDTAVQLIVGSGDERREFPIWVMHPERCMESRIYNADLLGKTAPLALRQLRASIACARAWSAVLLDSAPAEQQPARAVLRLNERVFRKCLRDRSFRNVFLEHGIDPFAAVLVDERLPDRFRARRYPDMTRQLHDQRDRDMRLRNRSSPRGKGGP